jgi:hypothetical protein
MLKAVAMCVGLMGLVPATATAEWHFTPMVGLTFKAATNIVDLEFGAEKTHKNFGGAVSLLGDGILGLEGIVVWSPGFFESDDSLINFVDQSRAVSVMGNVVLTTPRQWTEYTLRPYFSGGAGMMHATVTQADTLPQGPPLEPFRFNAPGFNLGVGAIGFFSERTGVRFDIRYHSTFRRSADLFAIEDDSSYLRYMTASVGIVWRRR